MKTYNCYRINGFPRVDVEEESKARARALFPDTKVAKFSQSFDWGFAGPEVDQLAVSMLMDLVDDRVKTLKNYEAVKWSLLVSAPRAGVRIHESQIRELIN